MTDLTLTPQQQDAIAFIYEGDESILVAETGEGKTVICLTAMKELIDAGAHKRFIVAVPAKVLEKGVWINEVKKWPHLVDLNITTLSGDVSHRLMKLRVSEDPVLVVSLNNLEWLLKQHRHLSDHNEVKHSATGIVIDELSKAAGKWTRALRSKKYGSMITWRCGLSASPVSQSMEKLFKMARIIDGGACLGTNQSKFEENYFTEDYNGHKLTLRAGAAEQILDAVAPIVHVMPDNKVDKLPPLNFHEISFSMPKETFEFYQTMKVKMMVKVEADLIDAIDSTVPPDYEDKELIVDAANAAVNVGKLRQIAAGFIYQDRERTRIVRLDQERMLAACGWWTALNGRPGLIFYEFVEQEKLLKAWVPANIEIAQINSMSHGVEGLQYQYADLLFYQPVWSRDAFIQGYGRLWRTGQVHPVNVTTLMCDDSVDHIVTARVNGNAAWMELLKAHLTDIKHEQ
jgi:hypothetical protein